MRAALFVCLLTVIVAAVVAAWHWRSGRVVAGERLQRALAVRPAPSVAPVVPVTAPTSVPPGPVKANAKGAEIARAESLAAAQSGNNGSRRAKDRTLVELRAKKARLELLLRNGAFLRSRDLAEADRERLLAAWVAWELDSHDVRALARETGLSLSDPALAAEFAAAQQRRREIESAVLGVEGAAAFTDYGRGQGIRDAVMNFHGEAALAGHPLTLEQADAVAAVLINSGRPGRPVRHPQQVDPEIAARLLADVLSPQQSDLLLVPMRSSIAFSKFLNLVTLTRQREASAGGATP